MARHMLSARSGLGRMLERVGAFSARAAAGRVALLGHCQHCALAGVIFTRRNLPYWVRGITRLASCELRYQVIFQSNKDTQLA